MLFVLQATNKCNINCSYCFEGKKGSSSMTIEMIPDIISFIQKYVKNDFISDKEHLCVNFNGGEPLLNFEFIKEAVSELKKINVNNFTMSTNFTLITSEILDFLIENNFYIQISLDGCKLSHDLCRKDYNNNGTFEKLVSKIRRLQSIYPEYVPAYAMLVIPETVDKMAENLKFLVELGCKNIITSVCQTCLWTEEQIAEFENQIKLSRLFHQELYDKGQLIHFSLLSRNLDMVMQGVKSSYCGVCKDTIEILPNGDILPCSFFVSPKEGNDIIVGNIKSGINKKAIIPYLDESSIDTNMCDGCILADRCRNKCFAVNYQLTGDKNYGAGTSCWVNRSVIMESDKLLDYLLTTKNKTFNAQYKEQLTGFKENAALIH